MKIAVTGGSGFVGQWLLRRLKDEHDFVVIGRKIGKKKLEVKGKQFRYIETNYLKKDLSKKLRNIDAVVHLAATRVGSNSIVDFMSNITVSENLFNSFLENDISNVVCLSSISVYSDITERPWNEEQRVSPHSFYGISKVAMENIGHYFNRSKDMNIKSLRVAKVLGYGERSGYMLNTFINQAFQKETLLVYGGGSGRREDIYVKDVADAIICALDKPDLTGIFNIGTGKNISHLELARLINEVFDNKGNLKFKRDVKEDTFNLLMDIRKAKDKLGWTPQWTIRDGLNDIRSIMEMKKKRHYFNEY